MTQIEQIRKEIERRKQEWQALLDNDNAVVPAIVKDLIYEDENILSLIESLDVSSIKSPFTGGKVLLLSKDEELTFRGEKLTITRQYYKCVDTGKEFTDAKVDDDMMWSLFRAYCNKKGFETFYDILPSSDNVTKIKNEVEKLKQKQNNLDKISAYNDVLKIIDSFENEHSFVLKKHYYVIKDGKSISDYYNYIDAEKHAKKIGGEVATEI